MAEKTSPGEHRPNPILRSERVYLRAIEPSDAEHVYGWYEHADTARLMGELPRSLARRRADAESATGEVGRDWFAFVICLLADDQPIGRADVFEIDRYNGSAGFGLAIGEHDLRGGGLGTEAVNVIVDFCFGQLRLERVWLVTDSVNLRAQHVYEKAGFVTRVACAVRSTRTACSRTTSGWRCSGTEWEALPRKRSWEYTER